MIYIIVFYQVIQMKLDLLFMLYSFICIYPLLVLFVKENGI